MKIVFFLPDLYGGGAERVVVNLVNELSKNHEVYLVLVRESGDLFSLVDAKVNIKILHSKRVFFSILNFYKYIKQLKPDVILSALDSANIVATMVSKLTHTPNIVTIHDYFSFKYSNKKLFQKLLGILRYSSKVISVSYGVKRDLEKFNIESTVIYNPVISKVEKSKKEKIIIAIGRLEEIKDFKTLIDAFEVFNVQYPEYSLVILGQGSLENELKEYTENQNIYFPGFVDVHDYLSQATLLVSTSIRETFGLVLVEALSYGIDIVATKTDGALEVLENGKYGYLIEPQDREELVKAMAYMVEHPMDEDILKTRALDFSIEGISKEYEKIIEEVYGVYFN